MPGRLGLALVLVLLAVVAAIRKSTGAEAGTPRSQRDAPGAAVLQDQLGRRVTGNIMELITDYTPWCLSEEVLGDEVVDEWVQRNVVHVKGVLSRSFQSQEQKDRYDSPAVQHAIPQFVAASMKPAIYQCSPVPGEAWEHAMDALQDCCEFSDAYKWKNLEDKAKQMFQERYKEVLRRLQDKLHVRVWGDAWLHPLVRTEAAMAVINRMEASVTVQMVYDDEAGLLWLRRGKAKKTALTTLRAALDQMRVDWAAHIALFAA